MINPSAKTKLIQCDLQPNIEGKWSAFVNGQNGFLYGIPYNATKVIEFNPENKSFKEIGPDLGVGGEKYWNGIMADNGSIYCVPYRGKYFLKITPMDGGDAEILILKDKEIPVPTSVIEDRNEDEIDDDSDDDDIGWVTGALANNGCIYYLPYDANRILKLNPNNDDSLSLVGDDFLELYTVYGGAIVGNDGCIYGIPYAGIQKLIKFNPIDDSISYMENASHGRKRDDRMKLSFLGGALASDGYIYAANHANLLKIDTTTSTFTVTHNRYSKGQVRWQSSPVLGADNCIYFPPSDQDNVLQYNPSTKSMSTVGASFENHGNKWYGAALASDGFVYCIPYDETHILQIDSRCINEQVLDICQNYL